MGSGYMRDTVKTADFCAILGGRVIREVGLYASMYGSLFVRENCLRSGNSQGILFARMCENTEQPTTIFH